MIDPPDRPQSAARFPPTAQAEASARRLIEAAVRAEIAAGGTTLGIAGGACRGDILFHEVCSELGIRTELLLALPELSFQVTSVQRGGPHWVDRYRTLCERVVPRVLQPSEALPRWPRAQPPHRRRRWHIMSPPDQALPDGRRPSRAPDAASHLLRESCMRSTSDHIDTDTRLAMRSIIERIATGPELSKDISQAEAHLGTRAILENKVDPVQAGIFLIALRMKRETAEENRGVLDAVREATQGVTAEVDAVVDIADPYDGYNRSLPAAPFLPAVLAECGLHLVTHGLDAVGPKYGVTHRHVLAAAGVPVDLTPATAAGRLADPTLGWTYVDQARFCPALHDLVPLRSLIIKRQALTTVEVLAKPIAGRLKTHFVTGFTHDPFPPVYAMLARHVGFDSALIIRGTEGGIIPSLRQKGQYFYYHDRGEAYEADVDPCELGIEETVRAVPLPEDLPKAARPGDEIAVTVDLPATAKAAAAAGLAALQGERGPTYDSLVLGGALILNHVGRHGALTDAADHIRRVLDSGRAAQRVR